MKESSPGGGWLRKRLRDKTNATVRLLMNCSLSGLLPLFIVTEYPKSGGTWFGQMLSSYLDVPFPRNRFPTWRSCVMHGHYLPWPGMRNVFVVFRDGRDVMLSMYHHYLFPNNRFNQYLVAKTRQQVAFRDYSAVRQNLPEWIEFVFTRNRHPRFHWAEFAEAWISRRATFVKYEDLSQDAGQAMAAALQHWSGQQPDGERLRDIAEEFSFENQAGRPRGSEKKGHFLRKGIAGDWVNYFDRRSAEVFHKFAGEQLIQLGYESDQGWIDNCPHRIKE